MTGRGLASVDSVPPLGARDAAAFAAVLMSLRGGYVPEWRPGALGADAAIIQIAARQLEAVARRLEQAPSKNELAFLEMLGTRLVPAQPARAPMIFRLAADAADVRLPAGTRVAAQPPAGSTTPIAYETETSTGLAAARLQDAVSLWPGRDQFVDHGGELREGRPFRLFERRRLENTPHALYLAHDTLLALAGQSAVTVGFDLTTRSSEYLDIRWEYWDGTVWRAFKDMHPVCSNEGAAQLDSTSGLRTGGAYRLEADCAETAPTTIGGVEAFWVRGRLEETLPADPERVLPEVESIRLSTQIARSYAAIWRSATRAAAPGAGRPATKLGVRVQDATGVPLPDIEVHVVETDKYGTTQSDGVAVLDVQTDRVSTVAIALGALEQQEPVLVADVPLELTFRLDMPALERAAFDGAAVDLSKPFFPFGLQPQPGAAFYVSHGEAFAKPGALLRFCVQPAATPQGAAVTTASDKFMPHVVSWEYWNGSAWASLLSERREATGAPEDFRALGLVELVVPDDMAPTTVAQQEGLWMRVRLVSGGYGFTREVPVDSTKLSFFVPQPPALADLRLGYAWQNGPSPPERVLAFNDFRYEDRTREAVWPGEPFQPFVPIADPTPGLYLGFGGALPVDSLGLFFDVLEQSGETEGPALVWEYWDGFDWRRLAVSDETHDLRVPGIVRFVGPDDMRPLARFGTERHWLRARLNEDGPPGEPTLNALLANAAWAVQRQTVIDEPVGTSTGEPGQVLAFRQAPILPGQRIEVRELTGRRANVEWRILASELFGRGSRAIGELEVELAAEGEPTDVSRGPLRLRRDRLKQVTEAWVCWEERLTLWLSAASDRHYAIDRARGRLLLGDGERGRVPPFGAAITAREYRTGGGTAGNVAARKIDQVLGPVGGIQSVVNAAPAEGGADAETAEQVILRGPRSIRHRGRAVTAPDFEALAREASPSVAVARAIPGRDPAGRQAAGWVTLVIIPSSAEPRPMPSFGLRERVRRFVAERAAADLAAAGQIVVTGPRYQPVDVTATLVIHDAAQAGAIERAAHDAIATFLHPLRGGPVGRSWLPGQDVSISDLASVVERVEGVDLVRDLALLQGGVVAGTLLSIAADRIPVAGEIRLRLVGA